MQLRKNQGGVIVVYVSVGISEHANYMAIGIRCWYGSYSFIYLSNIMQSKKLILERKCYL